MVWNKPFKSIQVLTADFNDLIIWIEGYYCPLLLFNSKPVCRITRTYKVTSPYRSQIQEYDKGLLLNRPWQKNGSYKYNSYNREEINQPIIRIVRRFHDIFCFLIIKTSIPLKSSFLKNETKECFGSKSNISLNRLDWKHVNPQTSNLLVITIYREK